MQSDSLNKIFRGTIIITLISVLAKLAAFIQETILAAYLGTNYQSDAFYMVTSIQSVIYPMLSVGIWKVFLPLYKERIAIGDNTGATSLANKLITLLTIGSLLVVVVLITFSTQIVSIVAPGFQGETKELCSHLVRLSSPMYIVIIAAAVYASMLQCHNKFLGSQIREVASHVPVILAAVFFYKKYGVDALAIALVVGGICRLLIELPFVDWSYKFKLDFEYKDKGFIIVLKRLPSALISEGVNQLNTLLDKVMASMLPEGTISGLNYGSKLVHVFSGLFSSAVATAMYPQMIELVALKRKKELSNMVERIMNIFAIIMIPVTVACVLFSSEFVTVVYARGSFNINSVKITSGIFAFYSLGLYFVACNTVLNNIFYSEGDTKTPMYISIINLICNVGLNFLLLNIMGVNGLPLATSLSSIITFTVRLTMVKKYVDIAVKKQILVVTKILGSALMANVSAYFLMRYAIEDIYLRTILSIVIVIPVYFTSIWAMKVDGFSEMIIMLRKRIKRIV